MTIELRDPIDDHELERRLRATFTAIVPQLDAPSTRAASDASPSVQSIDVELRIDPTSPVGGARRPGRIAAVMLTTAAALALLAVVVQRDHADQAEQTDAPDGSAATQKPVWYDVLRPLLPDGFDQIAMTYVGPDSVDFLAIRTGTGQVLDISIGLQAEAMIDPTTTTAEYGTTDETASGLILTTPDRRFVSLSCGVVVAPNDSPVGSIGQIGFARDYCGDEFDNLGIDPASRRALVVSLARDFPIDAVGSFGTVFLPEGLTNSDFLRETIPTLAPGIQIADPGITSDHAVMFVDLATSASAPATAQLSIVTGVYPPRAADANPAFAPGQPFDDASWRMAVYDDFATGWMVDDGGVGFQIATTDLSQGNLDLLGTLLERLALLSTSGRSTTPSDSTSTLFVTIPPQTTTTSLLVDPQTPMPDAYVQLMSMLPGDAWNAVAVQPGDPIMLTVFDVGGRQLSASYVESADPISELPPMTLPANDGFGFIQSDGSVIVQSADGDGVAVSCQLIADTSTSDCSPIDGLPPLSLADLTQVGRDLLPLLRQGQTGPLGSLVYVLPITLDPVAAEARYRDELGADDGEFVAVPGVTTEMADGEPNIFRAADGSSTVTIVVNGVLFQRHEHAGVPTEQVAAAMRLMSRYVTDLRGPIVTTTTLTQP